MSNWKAPNIDEKKHVNPPIIHTNNNKLLLNSKINEHLTTKNTPAVTIVAACIKADTGVGPSIASGNQICKPNCADLPIAPKNKKKPIIKNKSKFLHKKKYT